MFLSLDLECINRIYIYKKKVDCILYLSVKLDCVSLIGLPVLDLQQIISD